METLYILECEDNKWYVGKSADVQRRFKQHTQGKGSEWTREYAPLRIAETRPITSPYDETNVTKELMKKHGIDNVRGGAHASIELSEETENFIQHELRAANDSCYKCGKKGHFANQCKRKSSFVGTCGCGREFLDFDEFMSHQKGCLPRQVRSQPPAPKQGTCYRCGRPGHYSPECYARTHVRGYALDESSESESEEEDSYRRRGRGGYVQRRRGGYGR
jgi:predicted GIY-YIG superfamily endonuclease